jgi:hypothetical protein
MWELTNQLTGSMGLYTDNSTSPNAPTEYTEINSNIENSPLLGSADLDCFFAIDAIFNPPDKWLDPPSPQRAQDILFAENNNTLENLIPELAFNLTVSLMNNNLLA